jgi:hypothetical protein
MDNNEQHNINSALFEYLTNKSFENEPLARALLCVLIEKGLLTNSEVIDKFDSIIKSTLNRGIDDYKEN